MEPIQKSSTSSIYDEGDNVRKVFNKNKKESFVVECKILDTLGDFPGIVKKISTDPENLTIILEKGEEDLFSIASFYDFKMEEFEVVRYIRDVCKGLRYCHSKGIVHNDVKMENVLIVNGVVKLIDFNLSFFEGDKSAIVMCGTKEYLAPENIHRKKDSIVGTKVDSWAVGVMCYEMMNGGDLPFFGKDYTEIYRKILNDDFKFITKVSDQCQNFVRRLLTKDIELRMSIEEALEHPWLSP